MFPTLDLNWTGEALAADETRTIDMRNTSADTPPRVEPHIRFSEISKVFAGPNGETFRALDNVNLSIGKSEFFTLLGPSGCGKTTLLRMLAGFIDPTSGEITIDGKNQIGTAPNARPVNTVFQSYALFPHMTVTDNIAFGLRMLGWPRAEIAKRIEEVITLVRLEAFSDRKPSQLSGGQQQRVALARALAPKPKVLLLDEPLSALDLKLRKEMQVEMTRIRMGTETTFLFVTHDQEEALTMSDRIAVMSAGRVQQVGTPDQIYYTPATRFVADFIGEMNFLDAVAVSHRTARLKACDTSIDVAAGTTLVPGAPCTLAIRPEFCRVTDASADAKGQLSGHVRRRIFSGAHTTLMIELAGGQTITCRLNGEDGKADTHFTGSAVTVDLPAAHLLAIAP